MSENDKIEKLQAQLIDIIKQQTALGKKIEKLEKWKKIEEEQHENITKALDNFVIDAGAIADSVYSKEISSLKEQIGGNDIKFDDNIKGMILKNLARANDMDKEISEHEKKLTWLSEENAKLYTQVDDDALKRAKNTEVLRELKSHLKTFDSGHDMWNHVIWNKKLDDIFKKLSSGEKSVDFVQAREDKSIDNRSYTETDSKPDCDNCDTVYTKVDDHYECDVKCKEKPEPEPVDEDGFVKDNLIKNPSEQARQTGKMCLCWNYADNSCVSSGHVPAGHYQVKKEDLELLCYGNLDDRLRLRKKYLSEAPK